MVPGLRCQTRASSKHSHSTAPTLIVEPSAILSQQLTSNWPAPHSQPNSTAPNGPSMILPQQLASNSPRDEYIAPPSQPNSTAPNETSAPLNVSNSAEDDVVIFN